MLAVMTAFLDKKIILILNVKTENDLLDHFEPLKSIVIAAKHKVAQLAFSLQQV